MSQDLPFGQPYPVNRQGTNFAQRFQVHALRCGVMYTHGAAAYGLLSLIVLTEGRRWYRGPVRFWRDHLLSILGVNRNRLAKITKTLVRDGWLHYEQGAKGRAAVYWVTVPGGDQEINDTPLGETDSDVDILHSNGDHNRDRKRAESVTASVTHSRDYQEPNLPPPSPHGEEEELRKGRKRQSRRTRVFAQDGSASPDPVRERLFSDLVAQASALGVSLAEEAIQSAVCRGASLEHIAAVLQHAAEPPVYHHPVRGAVRPWGGGAVWTRLDNPSHLMKPPSEGWARPDEDWQKLHAKALDAARREKAAVDRQSQKSEAEASTEVEQTRLRQLELQFGDQVNRLTNRDAIELLLAHGPKVSSYLVGHVRKSGTGGRVVRVALLKAFAEKAGSN